MTQIFLDDIRDPSWVYGHGADTDWVVLRSGQQFFDWISHNGLPDLISFDHDLGGIDEHGQEVDPSCVPSGMDCAHFLVNYCLDHDLPLPQYKVHSANPVGSENIRLLLESFQSHQARANPQSRANRI